LYFFVDDATKYTNFTFYFIFVGLQVKKYLFTRTTCVYLSCRSTVFWSDWSLC